jgi:muramoyltetrapeptide carboxypeptidase LdcA involved in peptidoglycan recycling
MMGVDQYNAVTEILKDFNVPIIMDADIGHIDPMLPVVMGADAKVSTKNNNIFIDYLS